MRGEAALQIAQGVEAGNVGAQPAIVAAGRLGTPVTPGGAAPAGAPVPPASAAAAVTSPATDGEPAHFCAHCGFAVPTGALYCPHCGTAIAHPGAIAASATPPTLPDPPPVPPSPGVEPPAPGYWLASDGNWYPPSEHPGR